MFAFEERARVLPTSDLEESPESKLRVIEIQEDFDLFHTVVYYMYTDRIAFSTDLQTQTPDGRGPKLCAAEDIYVVADMMLMEDLKSKTLDFLLLTCTVENITERVLGDFADTYKDVKDGYFKWFREHWTEVRDSQAYNTLFEGLGTDEEYDTEQVGELFRRYREVMQAAIFDHWP